MLRIDSKMEYDVKSLNDDFKEALKDDKFKTFVSKIKISSDILKKYTSILESCCKEYNNCLNCRGQFECKNQMNSYCYLPNIENGKLKFHYKSCKYRNNSIKNTKHLKNVKYYNTPVALKEATFEKIDKRIKARFEVIAILNDFVKNYPNNEKGLFLHGNFGCGKSYLISACFNELAKSSIKSAIVFWPEFLRNLKSSFNVDYDEKIEYIKSVELLLIDDLGAENVTPWGRDEILCSILQNRMDNKLTTFITSNLNMEELDLHLSTSKDGIERVKSKRIIERIKNLTKDVELISKNMREGK